MKSFLILAFLTFPILSVAGLCPDFSGKFEKLLQDPNSSQTISIEQNDCLHLKMLLTIKSTNGRSTSWTKQIILNGVEHESEPTIFTSQTLVIDSILEIERYTLLDGSVHTVYGIWALNQDRDLTYKYQTKDTGITMNLVYKRK